MYSEIDRLPFAINDELECRSFDRGYEGAWFRCKLCEITPFKERNKETETKELWCIIDYLDFGKDRFFAFSAPFKTKVFQLPHARSSSKCIMLRPAFPRIIGSHADAVPRFCGETILVKNRDYEPGDFVEWDFEDARWICQVQSLIDQNVVQVYCHGPPWGNERKYYQISKDKLRPALNWCPQSGWSVPLSKIRKPAIPCATLVNARPSTRVRLKCQLVGPFDEWCEPSYEQPERPQKQQQKTSRVQPHRMARQTTKEPERTVKRQRLNGPVKQVRASGQRAQEQPQHRSGRVTPTLEEQEHQPDAPALAIYAPATSSPAFDPSGPVQLQRERKNRKMELEQQRRKQQAVLDQEEEEEEELVEQQQVELLRMLEEERQAQAQPVVEEQQEERLLFEQEFELQQMLELEQQRVLEQEQERRRQEQERQMLLAQEQERQQEHQRLLAQEQQQQRQLEIKQQELEEQQQQQQQQELAARVHHRRVAEQKRRVSVKIVTHVKMKTCPKFYPKGCCKALNEKRERAIHQKAVRSLTTFEDFSLRTSFMLDVLTNGVEETIQGRAETHWEVNRVDNKMIFTRFTCN